jgi:type IV secretion system protein VirD4
LEIFANPIINAATSESDFDLRDLRKTKMTIYIGFPDNEKEMISPLLTLFWQQLISFMTEKLPDTKTEPYPLLCLMDEFSALGRLVNLKSSLKILRGYRVRVLIIVQYLAQTLEMYSRAEAESFKNIKTKVSFALDSFEDAEYVSKLLGYKTKRVVGRSATHQIESSSTSKSEQLQSLPLMRPEDIMRMKEHQALILRTGHPPIKAGQCRWYKERSLKHLPCGETEIPIQSPKITPFERPPKKSVQEDEEEQTKEILKEERTHRYELEKIKVKAEILADAFLNAITVEQGAKNLQTKTENIE